MKRFFLAVAGCAALLIAQSAAAQGLHSDTIELFENGLSGWTTHGEAQWSVSDGVLVGEAASPGLLAFEDTFQDVILRFTYQCEDCEGGVVLRSAPTGVGSMQGLYVDLSDTDAPTLSTVTLDEGAITDREEMFVWDLSDGPDALRRGSRNPAIGQLRVNDLEDGWRHIRLQIRHWTAPGAAGDAMAEDDPQNYPNFGTPGFRVDEGTIRFKDVLLTDLLHPAAGVAREVTSPNFRKVLLTDRFYSEGISAGDIDNDGNSDVLSGPYAYLGPEFVRAVEIYPPHVFAYSSEGMRGQYTDNFLNYVHDFDGDGWNDYLKVNFDGAYLYRNPQGASRYWDEFRVTEQGVSSETTQLEDIDGDGALELLGSAGSGEERLIGYWKAGGDATDVWSFIPISEAGDWGGHGYGVGDINQDGRLDVIQGSGWWEQPGSGADTDLWAFHDVPFGRGDDPFIRGADMFAYDVNGDGLPDVITSQFAHGPGLTWYEQHLSSGGEITWTPHIIMDAPEASAEERDTWETTDKNTIFTELHAIRLVDMDGDGVRDIISGKRWFSHGMEYPENDRDDPAVVGWFRTVRKADGSVEFAPEVINNYVGIGTQIEVVDVNGDGRPDVLTSQRKGAYVFVNDLR
jgi:hypothetical protein